jgi:hypothetical protein
VRVHARRALSVRACAAALLILLLACASGGPSKPETTTAPGADIPAYRSFGFEAAGAEPLSIRDANLRNAIRARLLEKGYSEDSKAPDLRIHHELATSFKEKTSDPPRIGIGMGSWGGPVGVGVDTSVPVGSEKVDTVPETRLTIHAVDSKSNTEVWAGSTASEAQGLDAKAIEAAVNRVLKEFPARRP